MTWLALLWRNPLVRWIGAALAAVAAVFGVYLAGKQDGRQDAAQQAAEQYKDTRKRIDAAPKPSDPSAAREWLHERQRQRDLRRDD